MPDQVMSIYRIEFDGFLEACPFCGKKAEMRQGGSIDWGYTYTVSCLHSNCRGFSIPGGDRYDTPERAAEEWNKRAEFEARKKKRLEDLLLPQPIDPDSLFAEDALVGENELARRRMEKERKNNEPWYGFDLDGTLAEYHGWQGEDHIGAPVAPIVRLITAMHRAGLRVKVMTARVAPKDEINTFPNPYIKECMTIQDPPRQTWALKDRWTAREFIQEWCYRNLGFVPEITHEKDYHMLQLFDDRCVQIETNTGRLLGRMPDGLVFD
jgi:hypothetical protein